MQPLWSSKPLLCRELVGREQELRELHEIRRLATGGKPQMVLLAGEAGVGKTKLCRAFIEECRAEQAMVLFGQALHQDQALPFGPILDALRRYFTTFSTVASPATMPAPTSVAILLRLFPELGSFFPGFSPPEPDGKENQFYQQQGIFHQMLASIQGLAQAQQKPLLLILEDLHWADETSLELLGFLAQRLEVNNPHPIVSVPLLIVGTYRLEALAESPALKRLLLQLQTQRLFYEIDLSPLLPAEHWRCVNSILNQNVPETFASYLFDWDEGNPFFTEELLGAMAANGQLQVQTKGWVISPDEKPHLPPSLTEAILERYRRLPEVDQEVLAYASIVGRVFDFSLLATLCQIDEHTLIAVLRRAVQAQLISEVSNAAPAEPERYQFRHALTRETIYNQMLTPERRLRHRAVAELLEQPPSGASAERRNEVTRLLAEHYWLAGLPEKARPYALREAERARRIFAFREERSYLNMAQTSLPYDSPERLQLLQRMGMLSLSIYELGDALHWYDMAKAGYHRTGDHHKALYVMGNLLFAHWQIGSPALRGMVPEIEAAAGRAFAELESTGGDVEMLAGTALLAHYWIVHSLCSRSAFWLERCFTIFESLDDPSKVPAIQLSHMTRGWLNAHRRTDDFEEGIAEIRHAIDVATDYRLPDVIMIGHTNLAAMQVYWGRSDEAGRTLQEAAEHEERSGTLLPSFVFGLHYFFSGKAWEQVIPALNAQIEQLERLHAAYLSAASRVSLAHILLARGELQEAETHLQAARPAHESNNEYIYLEPLWWGFAKLHTLQGHQEQARHVYEHILSAWKETENTLTVFPVLLDATVFYVEMGDLESARRWLAALESTMQVTDNPVGTTALQEARGLVLAAEGNVEEGLPLLRHAVETWGKLKRLYQHAQTSQRLARVLLEWASKPANTRLQAQSARKEASRLLEQAENVFTDLHVSSGLDAIRTLRNQMHLDAQEKRRHTLQTRSDWQGLTPREMEVLSHLAAGKSNKEIASTLHISPGTVEQHISHIFARLGCDTRTQAVALALQRGWIKG